MAGVGARQRLGLRGFKKLVARFGDPTAAFSAAPSELAAIDGLQRDAIEGLVGFSQWAEVEHELKRIRSAGITLVRYIDAEYPARLRAIADPPPLLYVKGCLRDERRAGDRDRRFAQRQRLWPARGARSGARLGVVGLYGGQRHGARHRRHGS